MSTTEALGTEEAMTTVDLKMKIMNLDRTTAILFKPGDVIQEFSPPFVKVLDEANKGCRCDFCFKKSFGLRRCSGCSFMYYCDRQCQRKDWKEAHSIECKSMYFKVHAAALQMDMFPLGVKPDFQRQMCRLYALLKLNPEREDIQYKIYNGSTRRFKDLISHEDAFRDDVGHTTVLTVMAKFMDRSVHCDPDEVDALPVEKERLNYLFRLAGIWKTNGITLLNEAQTAAIGSGIYIQGSYFDHSCRPTAITNFRGLDLQVRAIHTIKEGQKPMVTYLSGHRPRLLRAKTLRVRYNFDCHCDLCEEEIQSGDAMDYKLLESLKQTPPIVNWKTILNGSQAEVNLMRKCYVEYDERISNKLFVTLQEVANLGAPKTVLHKLANEAEDHLKTTFGSDCDDMKQLMYLRHSYGISQ